MTDYAIQIEHLSKEFRLGVVGHGTLYQDLQSCWARIRGKEDPNTVIQSHLGGIKGTPLRSSVLALDDVSFNVQKGETLAVIGSNGAGKSTLLKILSQITGPTTGRIVIENRIASLLEVGTGFHHEMTGRQNIYLNGAMLGMRRSEINRKFDEIVDFSGIESFIDTPVKRYSSGMYVRLAFSIAAHLDAETLIVDEVLAVGDQAFQKQCTQKMNDLVRDEGRTILFVSHNMELVRQLCQRAVVLDRGKLLFESDDVENAIRKYKSSNGQDAGLSWIGDDDPVFRHPAFTPHRLRLRNKDGSAVCSNISPEDRVFVEIEGEIESFDSRCDIGYVLYNESGSPVYCSYCRDLEPPDTEPWPRGEVVFASELPTQLLNRGVYYLVLDISSDGVPLNVLSGNLQDQAQIAFETERASKDSTSVLHERVGPIAPMIPWQIGDR